MPNLYGNIIDNLAVGLVGGAGVVAGASYSSGKTTLKLKFHNLYKAKNKQKSFRVSKSKVVLVIISGGQMDVGDVDGCVVLGVEVN